ncbi:ABC transporter permease [Streptococcus parauberis]|uniref:ABC transporter permease n=1 Tax=Streptococcus parauberis TaxID=1348 RepID=UPI0002BC1FB7|nr:ABC transporter permease [Streptococcus parauberis]EMF49934.1 ABC transporter permease protein [Streptococcus parauberis KRS-02109]UWM86115.1 FtsX-like permease family protein [Streptococcus parauberis]UWM88086.1 FtsX-like permease family protein [Streptococcus parauberis]WEM58926.1 FtsX-like permease family protein [Streptococcus parauberis]
MMKKTLWKDIFRSIWQTKGRFLSLFLLMALGSFALVGLKVSGPNLENTARHYINQHRLMDLSIMGSHGFSKKDLQEIKSIPNATYELSHQVEANFDTSGAAIRLQSPDKRISTSSLQKGRLPSTSSEIALSSWYQKDYKIGDTVRIHSPKTQLLNQDSFKIVGFYENPEIWSKKNLGASRTGDGNLALYGLIAPNAFKGEKNLARIRYNDLAKLNPFGIKYDKSLQTKEESLENIFYNNSKERLKDLQKKSLSRIAENEQKITEAETNLSNQEKKLIYLNGPALKTAKTKIDQARKELAKKEKTIEQAKSDVKAMPKPVYLISNRQTQEGGEGYQVYHSSTISIANVSNIFPVVLYLVAALVTFTTMTRFVDEERTNSGLLLAIGYSKKDIYKKFIIYGFIASALGTLIGVIGGTYLLSAMIVKICLNNLILESVTYHFYWNYTALAFFLAALSALLPAYLVARKELNQAPAQLLLPKPPSKGAKIFLERLPIIWSRLTFTQKVTARNIIRYKLRMIMTIVGVAGSVALLFSGLGIQSSLSKVIDKQFSELTPYDILLVSKKSEESQKTIQDYFHIQNISSYQEINLTSLDLDIKGQRTNSKVTVLSSQKPSLKPYMELIDDGTKKPLLVPKNGVFISTKLASFYNVKPGQNLTLTDKHGKNFNVKVANVIDMRVGHYIICSNDYYQKAFKQLETNPAFLINLPKHSRKDVRSISKFFMNKPEVISLSKNIMITDYVQSIVDSLNQVMALLVILSASLSLVILYNLTTINIAERIRELSTIKVLGFYDKEVTMYIFKETILLSGIGIILGLISGYYLHQLLMTLMGASNMNFGTDVDLYVYLVPVITITLLIIGLGFIVHLSLKRLDMLDALKSVD